MFTRLSGSVTVLAALAPAVTEFLFRLFGVWIGRGNKPLPAGLAAEIVGLAAALGVDREISADSHSTDGIFGYFVRFFHDNILFP